jgi:hypothetical protein
LTVRCCRASERAAVPGVGFLRGAVDFLLLCSSGPSPECAPKGGFKRDHGPTCASSSTGHLARSPGAIRRGPTGPEASANRCTSPFHPDFSAARPGLECPTMACADDLWAICARTASAGCSQRARPVVTKPASTSMHGRMTLKCRRSGRECGARHLGATTIPNWVERRDVMHSGRGDHEPDFRATPRAGNASRTRATVGLRDRYLWRMVLT